MNPKLNPKFDIANELANLLADLARAADKGRAPDWSELPRATFLAQRLRDLLDPRNAAGGGR